MRICTFFYENYYCAVSDIESFTIEYLIKVRSAIKISHTIHMLNIQIDTKSLELVTLWNQQHQFVPFCKQYETEFSIMYGYYNL